MWRDAIPTILNKTNFALHLSKDNLHFWFSNTKCTMISKNTKIPLHRTKYASLLYTSVASVTKAKNSIDMHGLFVTAN